MAPPTTKPRLTTLDPHQVALDAATRALHEHQAVTLALFAPAYSLAPSSPDVSDELLAKKTRLYKTLRRLADYAQGGGELGQPVREQFLRILPVIQSQLKLGQKASVPDATYYPLPVDALLAKMDTLLDDEPLAVVLRGAHAREQLETTSEPVTAGQLSILAGMSRVRVAELVTTGALKGKRLRTGAGKDQKRDNPYLVQSKEARKFLAERGVRGFTDA